ncbi:dihydrofolate reductase family protein [Dyadobacter chenhuakuii]|uniref:Dihydrofolate reductase family protein n=1 Tax=Dyadobacter chenhuakuii TaxID=2909339 RepID=A0A9X1TU25_9BACT|nr:dihydrofolate reductase family protein [Dyadobacter chenhuakuii]MCF2498938.1 dihydrofolate reductase family protein [Dyadobacter chenhuakuii]
MSKIIFDSGISLDGYFAGDNRSPQNPMGDERLNQQSAFCWLSYLILACNS